MKLSDAVRNHRANELPAAVGAANAEPRVGTHSVFVSEQFNKTL